MCWSTDALIFYCELVDSCLMGSTKNNELDLEAKPESCDDDDDVM
jgi:hypothetical protein